MPFYAEPEFNVKHQMLVSDAVSISTITASAVNTFTAATPLTPFFQAQVVTNVRLLVITAPGTKMTGAVWTFKNGANTFAVCTQGATAAGSYVDATMTVANATFTAGGQPTVTVVGTGTASADTTGVYSIWFETKEQFVSA